MAVPLLRPLSASGPWTVMIQVGSLTIDTFAIGLGT